MVSSHHTEMDSVAYTTTFKFVFSDFFDSLSTSKYPKRLSKSVLKTLQNLLELKKLVRLSGQSQYTDGIDGALDAVYAVSLDMDSFDYEPMSNPGRELREQFQRLSQDNWIEAQAMYSKFVDESLSRKLVHCYAKEIGKIEYHMRKMVLDGCVANYGGSISECPSCKSEALVTLNLGFRHRMPDAKCSRCHVEFMFDCSTPGGDDREFAIEPIIQRKPTQADLFPEVEPFSRVTVNEALAPSVKPMPSTVYDSGVYASPRFVPKSPRLSHSSPTSRRSSLDSLASRLDTLRTSPLSRSTVPRSPEPSTRKWGIPLPQNRTLSPPRFGPSARSGLPLPTLSLDLGFGRSPRHYPSSDDGRLSPEAAERYVSSQHLIDDDAEAEDQ